MLSAYSRGVHRLTRAFLVSWRCKRERSFRKLGWSFSYA